MKSGVGVKKVARSRVSHELCHALDQSAAEPCGVQMGALHAKECEFVIRIDQPQVPVEFEAVEDHDRIRQADMLRSQIAMAIDDAARLRSLPQPRADPPEGRLKMVEKHRCPGLVRPQIRAQKHGPVLGHFVREVPEGHIRVDRGALGALVEIRQNLGKSADILLTHASFLQADVKHAISRKTLHLDDPVYDLPFSSQGHRTWSGTGQGDNALIDTGRKAAV
jgi:hypothetical protein